MIRTQDTNTKTSALWFSLILNLAVTVFSAVGTTINGSKNGFRMFQFYTVDSNIFAMLACAVYSVFLIRQLVTRRAVPVWAVLLKYAAVCCLLVTFLVVVAVLAPMFGPEGYQMMLFTGDMMYHHLLCPPLAALSFFLFDRMPWAPKRAARFALLPTILYAVIIIILNLNGTITGPYPFLMVYQQPVYMSFLWCALILGGAYGIARLTAVVKLRISGSGSPETSGE